MDLSICIHFWNYHQNRGIGLGSLTPLGETYAAEMSFLILNCHLEFQGSFHISSHPTVINMDSSLNF